MPHEPAPVTIQCSATRDVERVLNLVKRQGLHGRRPKRLIDFEIREKPGGRAGACEVQLTFEECKKQNA